MSNNIVGIKYIGNKPTKSDNIAGTSAVWQPGQVINFSSALAKELLAHPNVFVMTAPDPNATTHIAGGKQAKPTEPVPFVNINVMSAEELATYARYNFNKQLDPKEPLATLRSEVQKLMVSDNLGLMELEALSNKKETVNLALEVSEEEYQAYLHGIVELKLVTVVKAETFEGDPVEQVTETEQVEVKPEQESAEKTEETGEATETLPELLARLDAKGLRTLAKENGVKISNTMSVEQLRTKILKDIGGNE